MGELIQYLIENEDWGIVTREDGRYFIKWKYEHRCRLGAIRMYDIIEAIKEEAVEQYKSKLTRLIADK